MAILDKMGLLKKNNTGMLLGLIKKSNVVTPERFYRPACRSGHAGRESRTQILSDFWIPRPTAAGGQAARSMRE
jgi:hypothetical protein